MGMDWRRRRRLGTRARREIENGWRTGFYGRWMRLLGLSWVYIAYNLLDWVDWYGAFLLEIRLLTTTI